MTEQEQPQEQQPGQERQPDPARDRHRRAATRRGRAFVTLSLVCVLGIIACIVFCAHAVHQDNQHWRQALRQQQVQLCGVIAPFAATPVAKPASPAHPGAAAAYAWHQRFVALDRQFKCGSP